MIEGCANSTVSAEQCGQLGFAFEWMSLCAEIALPIFGTVLTPAYAGIKDDLARVRRIWLKTFAGVGLLALTAKGTYSTHLSVPFLKQYSPDLLIQSLTKSPYTYPAAFVFFFLFVIFAFLCSVMMMQDDSSDSSDFYEEQYSSYDEDVSSL